MTRHEYLVSVIDLDGNTLAFLDAYGLKLTRRINGACVLEFSAATDDPNAAHLDIAARAVRLYRDGVLRFCGIIGEPFVDGADFVNVTAYDPIYRYNELVVGDETLSPLIPAPEAPVDAAEVAWALILAPPLASDPHLEQGTIQESVLRSGIYEAGRAIGDAIKELADADEGFFYRIDAVDPEVEFSDGGIFGSFNVMYPDAGATTPVGACFEFGPGTRANISEDGLELERFNPVNWVVAVGSDEIPGIARTVKIEQLASQAEYGMFQRWLSLPDAPRDAEGSQLTALRLAAVGAIEQEPRVVVRFDAIEDAPALFDDFDVGDQIGVYIDNGRTIFDGNLRVNEVKLEVDDDTGAERLMGVVAETVAPRAGGSSDTTDVAPAD